MSPNSGGSSPLRGRFIPEIEGVRGLALTLVVLFHVFGQGRVSGGVDVFLFVSGYLLTSTLVRRLQRPAGLSLSEQYRGMFLKLVPPALIVLAATAVCTLLFSPRTMWEQTGREIVAAGIYQLNWELINSQLAYGAAGPDSSPLQHYWSLSVQGQFFLLWPLVLVVLGWWCRRTGWSLRRIVLLVVVSTSAASFVWAILLTTTDQQVAYFSSFTRYWEIAGGGMLALVQDRIRMPRIAATALSWVGLTLIVTCGFVINGGAVFPGVLTLWPILGIAAVIVAADAHPGIGAGRLLSSRGLNFFAKISYPLYLWHWPVLVFYLEYRDQPTVGIRGATGVLVLSIVLAWVTQKVVGAPLDRVRGRWRPAPVLIGLVATTLVATMSVGGYVRHLENERAAALEAAAQPSPDHPGARALAGEPAPSGVEIIPSVDAAFDDLPGDIYGRGCIQNWRNGEGYDEVLVCEDDKVRPRKTIVLSGGSHTVQWYPAIRAIADAERWELVVVDKDGCRLTTGDEGDGLSAMCRTWNDRVTKVIADMEPAAVITTGSKTPEKPGEAERAYEGQAKAWQRLLDEDVPVIVLRDTPRFLEPVPPCLAENGVDLQRCGRARGDIYAATDPVLKLESMPAEAVSLDLTDAFCGKRWCDPVVGNVLAYRDQDHMTATYARTLDRPLRAALTASAPWLFR